tara:strand:+ start:1348 stop:1596 length:249 start_codon:yes stop_codon:yes gene_type:complete
MTTPTVPVETIVEVTFPWLVLHGYEYHRTINSDNVVTQDRVVVTQYTPDMVVSELPSDVQIVAGPLWTAEHVTAYNLHLDGE